MKTYIATPKNSCLAVEMTTSAAQSTWKYSSLLGKKPQCKTADPKDILASEKISANKKKKEYIHFI